MKKLMVLLLILPLLSKSQIFLGVNGNNHGPEITAGYSINKTSIQANYTVSLRDSRIPNLTMLRVSHKIGDVWFAEPIWGVAYKNYYSYEGKNGAALIYGVEYGKFLEWCNASLYGGYNRMDKLNYFLLGFKINL